MPALIFPQFDPVFIHIGPLQVRWYALAYISGLLIGWRYAVALSKHPPISIRVPKSFFDDFLIWATFGIILGGRIGYVVFYKPTFFFANPLEIFKIWTGGMSFHGGCLGMTISILLQCRRHKIFPLLVSDILAIITPIGLFLGRIANFINGELWGRVTIVPWAVIFPNAGPEPRHPSQLYAAGLEGIVLFLIMLALRTKGWQRQPGKMTGMFLLSYGILRAFEEIFRQPDAFLGFVIGPFTMGQILSIPMIVAGSIFIFMGHKRASLV